MESFDVNGILLRADGDRVVESLDGGKSYQPEAFDFWMAAAEPEVCMIDVGAYTGVYGIAGAVAGAEVWAFEPDRSAYRRMVENVELNQTSIYGFPVALSNIKGYAESDEEQKRVVLGGKRSYTYANHADANSQYVRSALLDEYGPRFGYPVAAIKIAVNGSELRVLRGALKTIREHQPRILVRDGDAAVREFLEPEGYRFTEADGVLLCSP